VFSYCLPAAQSGTSFLDLGAPAASAGLTPMLTKNGPTRESRCTGARCPPESVFAAAAALVDFGTVINASKVSPVVLLLP
jgi:hypothetical protein